MFAFAVLFPTVKAGSKGIIILPFLYVLDRAIGAPVSIMPIGIRISVIAVPYLWTVFMLFKFLKARVLLTSALSLLLVIPLHLVINYALSPFIDDPELTYSQ